MAGTLHWELKSDIDRMLGYMERTSDDMLQKLVHETSDAVLPFLRKEAPVGRHYTREGARLPGGELRDSLHMVEGELGAYLEGAEQGIFVIGGTAPHVIRPKNAKALSFYWERVGKKVIRKVVHHPGNEPNDFRQTAVQMLFDTGTMRDLTQRIMQAWVSGGAV